MRISDTITSTAGPYGRGTYVHTCTNPTWCVEAGGIGDGCGGLTVFTPPTVEALEARRAQVLRDRAGELNRRLEVDQRVSRLNYEADTLFRALEALKATR